MALYTSLPIYHDWSSLSLMLLNRTNEFPWEAKHTLGQDIKYDIIALVRNHRF